MLYGCKVTYAADASYEVAPFPDTPASRFAAISQGWTLLPSEAEATAFGEGLKPYVPGCGDDWQVRVEAFREAFEERWPLERTAWPLADEDRFVKEMERRHILQFSESDRRRYVDSRFASELGRFLNNRLWYEDARDPFKDPPTPERPLVLRKPPSRLSPPGWSTVLNPMQDSGMFDRVRIYYDPAADRIDWYVETWIPEERAWRREPMKDMLEFERLMYHAPARVADLLAQHVPLGDWCPGQIAEIETPPSPS